MEYGVDGLHPYTLSLKLGGLSYDTPGTTPGIPITFAYFPEIPFLKNFHPRIFLKLSYLYFHIFRCLLGQVLKLSSEEHTGTHQATIMKNSVGLVLPALLYVVVAPPEIQEE